MLQNPNLSFIDFLGHEDEIRLSLTGSIQSLLEFCRAFIRLLLNFNNLGHVNYFYKFCLTKVRFLVLALSLFPCF